MIFGESSMYRCTKKLARVLSDSQKKFVCVLAVLMLIGAVFESMGVTLMYPLVTAVTNSDGWKTEWYALVICEWFGVSTQTEYVKTLLILLIFIFVGKNLYLLFEYYVQYAFVSKSRAIMQSRLMEKYIGKPYTYYLYADTGEIIRVITNDTNQTFALLNNAITYFTEIVVSVVLGITVMMLSPEISAGLIVILLFEVIIIAVIIKPLIKRYGSAYRKELASANKWILQSINGIKSIKVSNTQGFFQEKYRKHANRMVDAERKNLTMGSIPKLIIEALTISCFLIYMLLMVLRGADLSDMFPDISAFAVAAMRLLPSVNKISTTINQVPFLEGSLDNIIDHLYSENEKSHDTVQENIVHRITQFEEKIELKEVTFSYPQTKRKILDKASICINAGQSIGIVGSSGAGKTTLVDIILGLLEPQEGIVEVDGIDIKEDMEGWHKQLAYIPQNIFLMDSTIKENVAFGIDKSEIDDEKVWDALRSAHLDELVKGWEKGLDTEIGEGGIRLSGGQRQRVGIARALYSSPKILFFDEATSALDNETEREVMSAIDELKGKRTIIIVAHRLTTIEKCDSVYKVEKKIEKIR